MRFALFIAILLFCIVVGVIGAEVDGSAYVRPANSVADCDVWAYDNTIHKDASAAVRRNSLK
jgi:hypothetical protein